MTRERSCMMRILCSSEYCLSATMSAHSTPADLYVPCRCRLSYSFSPKVCGSCSNSRAGNLGVDPNPAALFLRFYPIISWMHRKRCTILTLLASFLTCLNILSFFFPLFPTCILCSNFFTSLLASLIPSSSSLESSAFSASVSEPRKKCKVADWTFVFG